MKVDIESSKKIFVTDPSISEEKVLNSDGSYSAHQGELVNDSSPIVDGVLLNHVSYTAGPPMDNDDKPVNFESSMDEFVTRRNLDVALRTLESKIEDCFAKLQQVIVDKMTTRVSSQDNTSQVANGGKSTCLGGSGVNCDTEDFSRESMPLKDPNNRLFKRRRRRFRNGSMKSSDGITSSDEAIDNLTTGYINRGNASRKVSTSTFSSDSSNQKDCSSDSKSEVVKKRRQPFKKTKTSRASSVSSNVADLSQSTRGNTNRSANDSGESAFEFAWSKSALETRLTKRYGTCVEYRDQVSQREKDDRPSSYAYNLVYNCYAHSKVDPRRFVRGSRFHNQYELANHFVDSHWEVPCYWRSEVLRES